MIGSVATGSIELERQCAARENDEGQDETKREDKDPSSARGWRLLP